MFQAFTIGLILLFEAISLRGGVEDVTEFVELDGLKKVVMGAGQTALVGRLLIAAGGQHDHANLRPTPADFTHQPDAAATWHTQVGHNDRRELFLQQFKGLFRGAGGLATIVPGTRRPDQDVLGHRFIIDDGDGDLRGGLG